MKRIQKGLYDSAFEHDACGIGAVISINGIKSHKVVDDALKIVEKLELISATKENMLLVCFSFRRKHLREIKQKSFLRSLPKGKVLNFCFGALYPPAPAYSAKRQ